MKKERMITRTIKFTVGDMIIFNSETMETVTRNFKISGEIDSKTLLKMLRKTIETETETVAGVINVKVEEQLFGMPETEFMEHAVILPPRTTEG